MNFLVSTLLMMIALQLQQMWIAMGILVISVLTSKELSTVIMFILATIIMFFLIGTADDSAWLFAIFGLIVIALLFGSKTEDESTAGAGGGLGGYGDMFGGMGMGGYQ